MTIWFFWIVTGIIVPEAVSSADEDGAVGSADTAGSGAEEPFSAVGLDPVSVLDEGLVATGVETGSLGSEEGVPVELVEGADVVPEVVEFPPFAVKDRLKVIKDSVTFCNSWPTLASMAMGSAEGSSSSSGEALGTEDSVATGVALATGVGAA